MCQKGIMHEMTAVDDARALEGAHFKAQHSKLSDCKKWRASAGPEAQVPFMDHHCNEKQVLRWRRVLYLGHKGQKLCTGPSQRISAPGLGKKKDRRVKMGQYELNDRNAHILCKRHTKQQAPS
eukprot:1156398-Pelagomonas_calceolata.AAC.9